MFKGKKLGEICKHNFKHLYSLQQSSSSGTILMEVEGSSGSGSGEQQAAKYQHGTVKCIYPPTAWRRWRKWLKITISIHTGDHRAERGAVTLRAFHLSWGQPLSDGYKDRKREIIIQNGHLKWGLSLSEYNKTQWWVGERINIFCICQQDQYLSCPVQWSVM